MIDNIINNKSFIKDLNKINIDSNKFKNIVMPDIGSDAIEITEILVKLGDKINKNQEIITVEGDKVSMEIPSPFSGKVKKIYVKIGDKIKTNNNIILLKLNHVLNDNTLIKNNIYNDKNINQKNKILNKKYKNIYDNNIKKNLNNNINYENKEIYNNNIHASPIIKRIAREFDINLNNIIGTGRNNRIIIEDINNYIKSKKNIINVNNSVSKNFSYDVKYFTQFGKIKEINLSKIKKISGKNLYNNWITIPHVTNFDEIDITDLNNFIKKENNDINHSKINIKIKLITLIIKIIAKALIIFPNFNSSLSDNKEQLILKKYVNIGVAVATKNGLVVPVLKNVHKKNLLELNSELYNLIDKSKSNNLLMSDINGGCFTISNLGRIGGLGFTPIINFPEVAILGISKAIIKPIWNGKKFIPKLMLPLSLSYDHRVIDGLDAAKFIEFIKHIVLDIRYLLL